MGIFDDQRALLRTLIDEVASRLSGDQRVGAIWLAGSLGREEGDALSDIDLIVVSTPGRTQELAASLEENLEMAGPVALVHKAPQNAPFEGAQLNVLYDTNPLPVYLDWNVWPPIAARPSDVSVLFEREPLEQIPTASFDSILAELPRGRDREDTQDRINHFRIFMTPIFAKDAARGWFESANRKLEYMRIPGAPITNLDGAIKFARKVLEDFGPFETEAAISCIHRYLSLVEGYRE